jgi:transcription elongation factor GreA
VRNNPLQGLVSIDSPIGKSLIGHKTGETVHVQVNKDFGYDVVVKSVVNTPDDDSIELRKF